MIDSTTIWELVEAGGKLIAPAGIVGAAIYAVLRWRLAEDFVTKKAFSVHAEEMTSDLDRLSESVAGIERRLASLPDHDDIRELFKRLGAVEAEVKVAATGIGGLGQSVGRIEKFIEMLVENEIRGEKK